MAAASSESKPKRGFLSRIKKEVSKDLLFFTVGALTASITLINRRQQKRLKKRYKNQVKKLKSTANK